MKGKPIKIDGRHQLSGMLIYNDKEEVMLLHRIDHDHYETPGGKVDDLDCKNPKKPTEKDYRNAAIRETFEEAGQEFIFEDPEYVGNVTFLKPKGKEAIAHKFKTRIVFGKPEIKEPKTFDKIKWFSKEELEKENSKISNDLKLFLKEKLI